MSKEVRHPKSQNLILSEGILNRFNEWENGIKLLVSNIDLPDEYTTVANALDHLTKEVAKPAATAAAQLKGWNSTEVQVRIVLTSHMDGNMQMMFHNAAVDIAQEPTVHQQWNVWKANLGYDSKHRQVILKKTMAMSVQAKSETSLEYALRLDKMYQELRGIGKPMDEKEAFEILMDS
ncbi:hypothetical protein HDU76_009279, partial [Blyttiomyces sp. JEL0837]